MWMPFNQFNDFILIKAPFTQNHKQKKDLFSILRSAIALEVMVTEKMFCSGLRTCIRIQCAVFPRRDIRDLLQRGRRVHRQARREQTLFLRPVYSESLIVET